MKRDVLFYVAVGIFISFIWYLFMTNESCIVKYKGWDITCRTKCAAQDAPWIGDMGFNIENCKVGGCICRAQ